MRSVLLIEDAVAEECLLWTLLSVGLKGACEDEREEEDARFSDAVDVSGNVGEAGETGG